MELCPGGSLSQWLTPEDRRLEEEVRAVGIQLADALAQVHAQGVVHHDVKPANVLIDVFGRPRLADFGLASVAGVEIAATPTAQPASALPLRMTPSYAPPEVATAVDASEAGDVFSLAATMYALLAGRPPRDLAAVADLQQLSAAVAVPIAPIPGVNWFLMDALMVALSSDPTARPSAAELRDLLSAVPGTRRRSRPLLGVQQRGRAPVLQGAVHPGAAPTAGDRVRISSGPTAAARAVEGDEPAGGRRRRVRPIVLGLAVAVAAMVVSGAAWLATGTVSSSAPAMIAAGAEQSQPVSVASDPGVLVATTPPAAETPGLRDEDPSVAALPGGAIQVTAPDRHAAPFETVPIRGVYRDGASTFVEVQHRVDGDWRAFPVPAKTDAQGRFTAYVELGRPSRYELRVSDPRAGVQSEPFVLVIKR
jgi:hypothetical protein